MLRVFGKVICSLVSDMKVEPEEMGETRPTTRSLESAVTSTSTPRDHVERPRKRAKREEVSSSSAGVSTELTLFLDPWKIKKRMTASDLKGLSRLMLAKKGVEEHALPMMDEETIEKVCGKSGLEVRMVDDDTGVVYNMVFKLWHSSNSYVINKSWSKFVDMRGLKVDDEVGLRWDPYHGQGQFHICVLNRAVQAD